MGKPTTTASKRALTPALAKRVAAEVARKQATLRVQGEEDVALVLRKAGEIAHAFYDIGEALGRLSRPAVYGALGHASFAELCSARLGLSLTQASRLVAIARRIPRAAAVRMGQERAGALLDLADATPADDTPTSLTKGTLALPGGETLDLANASIRELRGGAKAFRAARSGEARPRGRTVTTEERAVAAAAQGKLRAAGMAGAKVTALATKPGQPANVRIEGVPLSALPTLAAALAGARKGRGVHGRP